MKGSFTVKGINENVVLSLSIKLWEWNITKNAKEKLLIYKKEWSCS